MAATPKAKVREKGGDKGRQRARTPDGGDRRIMRDEGYAAATSRRWPPAPASARRWCTTTSHHGRPVRRGPAVRFGGIAGPDASGHHRRGAASGAVEINTDSQWSGLHTEFMALANHRKVIGAELKAYAERVRDIETGSSGGAARPRHRSDEYPRWRSDAGGPDCPKPVQRERHRDDRGAPRTASPVESHLNRLSDKRSTTWSMLHVNRHRQTGW